MKLPRLDLWLRKREAKRLEKLDALMEKYKCGAAISRELQIKEEMKRQEIAEEAAKRRKGAQ